jgi:hypothetical protein
MPVTRLRALAAKVVRPTLQRLNAYVPARAALGAAPPALLYGVYRAANAHHVARLLSGLGPGVTPHLHALDSEHPSLAAWTRSSGPGSRMPLIQALIDAAPPGPDDYVVIADDDVTFAQRGPSPFLSFVASAGFDIAQPAHAPRSQRTYRHLEVGLATTARRVGFVEVGPLVVLSPRAQRVALPFPADARMGWGVDISWSGLAQAHDLRLGVVDATPMTHHGRLWGAYETDSEVRQLDRSLAELGRTSADDFFVTVGPRWRPWHRRAPWLDAEGPDVPRRLEV